MKDTKEKEKMEKKNFAYSFPILPEKVDKWLQFVQEVKTVRKKDFSDMHSRIGVYKEFWYLQKRKENYEVIVYTEAKDEHFLERFKNDHSEFSQWFRKRVSELQPIDLNSETKMPKMVLSWPL